MHMFFSTIGGDGSRQSAWESPVFVRVLQKVIFILVKAKICNGKYKGLAIQYIFHDCFENSREICIQYIFHDCFENSRGKYIEPYTRILY